MVIMGIDASTTSTGISIFDEDKLVYHTTIKPEGEDWRDRLFHEGPAIRKIIEYYHPEKAFMEDVPLQARGGLKTLVILGGVQGYFYGILASYNIRIYFLSPTEWRSRLKMFNGTKDGKKREVLKEKAIKMANEVFGLNLVWNGANSKKTQDDEAEAILIAYSQIVQRKFGRT